MVVAKAAGATPVAAEAMATVSRPKAGGVTMVKTRVEVDLGRSRKSRPSGRNWATGRELQVQYSSRPELLGRPRS
jgi:hypothetical protein